MQLFQQRLEAIRGLKPLNQAERTALDVRALKKGGYFDLNDQTYRVEKVNRYLDVKWKNFKKRSADYWVTELKLFCLHTGETLYLEWEEDDELEVVQTDNELKLREIIFKGKPVSHADLNNIAEEEYGEVIVNNTTYYYSEDDSWAALFYEDSNSVEGIPVRCFEFESDSGTFLTIELWQQSAKEKPEREAFLSHSINPQNIQVLQIEEFGQ
jgi:hypothetical protein